MLHASKVKHACVWFMVGIKYNYCIPLMQESDNVKKNLVWYMYLYSDSDRLKGSVIHFTSESGSLFCSYTNSNLPPYPLIPFPFISSFILFHSPPFFTKSSTIFLFRFYDFCPSPSPAPAFPQAPSLSHYPNLSSSPKYNNSICDVSPSVLTFLSAMNMPIIGGRVHPCQEIIKLLHH